MKCLSVHQPYPALIMLPDDHPDAKRVENRGWATSYRGPLLIHASKTRRRIEEDDDRPGYDLTGVPLAGMAFGAIVGACRLVDCIELEYRPPSGGRLHRPTIPAVALRRHPWLAGHVHVEGPWCWVLTEVRAFDTPVPWRGAQGLFEVPSHVIEYGIGGAA